MPVLSLPKQQVIGNRCILDWMGYKSPDQPAVRRALDSRQLVLDWSLDSDWILDSRRRLFYITLELTVHYIFGLYSHH